MHIILGKHRVILLKIKIYEKIKFKQMAVVKSNVIRKVRNTSPKKLIMEITYRFNVLTLFDSLWPCNHLVIASSYIFNIWDKVYWLVEVINHNIQISNIESYSNSVSPVKPDSRNPFCMKKSLLYRFSKALSCGYVRLLNIS